MPYKSQDQYHRDQCMYRALIPGGLKIFRTWRLQHLLVKTSECSSVSLHLHYLSPGKFGEIKNVIYIYIYIVRESRLGTHGPALAALAGSGDWSDDRRGHHSSLTEKLTESRCEIALTPYFTEWMRIPKAHYKPINQRRNKPILFPRLQLICSV